ncbi:MAG TPA: pilus assembly PilX N-terminal domain-containing protein [Pyrinomonadaceae bacterium]|nr:pilus assembly PilX N-terminal domain-containing protein [Pyrinomonadaceae bacterium]
MKIKEDSKRVKQQRGAALITVLMISTLLLATGGALVLVTGLSTRTAIDQTAEMQAYYSAETGLQDTLNALRGNVNPQSSMPLNSKISFRNAVTLLTSNRPGDPSTTPRLSGWLNYNYSSDGGAADRVALTPNYSPMNGLAYSVEVSDPDNTPIIAGEPTRLLVRVRGFGPKGAEKHLELSVARTNVDYSPAAMLMMRGADDCSPMSFTIGDSDPKEYSGHDRSGSSVLPTFGATCGPDETTEATADTKDTVASPKSQLFGTSSLPPWLQSADEARAFLADQKANAIAQGRYFTSLSGSSGTTTSPEFTFVDGDCTLDGGGGLLIVTGNLILNGNPNFNGLILVLGGGHIQRNGGGDGDIFGAISVAKFNINGTGGFQAPFFDTNGGGTSTMQYDSSALRQALNVSGPRVQGVHEY